MVESNVVMTSTNFKRELEEANLVQAARRDPQAFGELYLLYVKPVFRYLYSRVGSVPEAEDITAQTFLAAYESFASFRQNGHFSSWLFAIARNKTMDHFRRHKNTTSIDDGVDIPVNDDPLSGVIQSERSASLAKLIKALPEDDRELLRLRFLAAMTFAEIAHFLHRNEDAVKKTTYRLLARLHSQLEISNE